MNSLIALSIFFGTLTIVFIAYLLFTYHLFKSIPNNNNKLDVVRIKKEVLHDVVVNLHHEYRHVYSAYSENKTTLHKGRVLSIETSISIVEQMIREIEQQ